MKPTTLEEAIEYYLPKFKGMEEDFNRRDEESFAAFCHSQISGGIGMKIRNEMGFWTKDSELYKHMIETHKLEHPDEMSDLIIRGIYRTYHGNLYLN